MSCNLTVTQIDENQIIGDSLETLNQNFANVDNAVCFLSARVSSTGSYTLGVTSLSGYYKLDATPQTGIVTVSEKFCPHWHVGATNRPLYQEVGANRISQQVRLSAEYLQHLQYVVSQNTVLSGCEKIRNAKNAAPANSEGATI